MNDPSVSVVIVSYDRPDDLELCLKALTFQYRRNFEIIVVCNTGSKPGVFRSGIASEIKLVQFESANISAARNCGISMAAGELIAFIDDDAIAEPTWLSRLSSPFSDLNVLAAGGFVVGRNGFDLQWSGEIVDDFGVATSLELTETTVLKGKPGAYPKTHGTNCAFRRKHLVDIGGFDENFQYFLDETDLNVRMGKSGSAVAIVPSARVHHTFSSSQHRKASKAPRSLFEIGASISYFVNKYQLGADHLHKSRQPQRTRLEELMVLGLLEPREVTLLMASLEEGILSGADRLEKPKRKFEDHVADLLVFRPYSAPTRCKTISCRRLFPGGIWSQAAKLSAEGQVVTCLVFSWTSARMKSTFHPNGFWVQKGGLFGRSYHKDRLFNFHSLSSRTRKEKQNLHLFRYPSPHEGSDLSRQTNSA